ncbi:hypothetical protein [Brevibacillus panacihumi]|uniref:hypothetical protein n=1 Tax=Brevibacillus panacihumi TaxID=497735 RepID=UPI003D19A34F
MENDIPLNEYADTPVKAMQSFVDSTIQDYCNAHGISLGTRTLAAVYYGGDGFTVTRLKPGSNNVLKIGGEDWQEFFDQNVAYGTDEDTSQNRTFTISDGTKTATITLVWNLNGMDDLVDAINDELTSAGVQGTAEKVNSSTFKIVAKKANITITIGGADSNDFF